MKHLKYILPLALLAMMGASVTSCDDMLDMGNDDVLYADENHLTQGTDTVNSFVGILAQLQKIAVRTNLYGELRGDLVIVNENANADLKAIANFEVSDSNAYNNPRDYYAVINNCNYYLANADTTLTERRYDATTLSAYDFRVFQAEYAAVRAIRAWVYLQLGQIYGQNIPLVTKPILSLDDANEQLASAEKKSLSQLCDYFIEDLKPYVSWFAYPYHHATYGYSMPSRMAVLPIQLVLGDLYLWSASLNGGDQQLAREAALCYYNYINWLPTEIGIDNNSGYKQKTVTSIRRTRWQTSSFITGNFSAAFVSTGNAYWSTTSFGTSTSEVISAIAMDSLASEDNYNRLRVLYNYDMENENVEASISPSQPCYDYSDGQAYAEDYTDGSQNLTGTVSKSSLEANLVARHYVGDLRLAVNLSRNRRGDNDFESQMIWKTYMPQDVVIYRVGELYLRMAEALNMAGFPKFALAILTTGLDNLVIQNEVLRNCMNATDSAFVQRFDFPTRYFKTRVQSYIFTGSKVTRVFNLTSDDGDIDINQIGIHTRGCGFAPDNEKYYSSKNDEPADSTGMPEQPPVYNAVVTNFTQPDQKLTTIVDANTEFFAWAAEHDGIEIIDLSQYSTSKINALTEFNSKMIAYSDSVQLAWNDAINEWYHDFALPQVQARQTIVVDSLLDVESALETPFEGFRFGRLMRAAYRSADPGAYMAEKVGKRDASLSAIVADPRRWFISWKGVIGQ